MRSHKENPLKSRLTYLLFNALICLFLPLIGIGIVLRWRERVLAKGKDRWSERWGRYSPEWKALFSGPGRWWWVHAVSMGEVKAIEAFLRKTPKAAGVKILLSAVTPEALEWATAESIADTIIAAPIDLPWIVRRGFQAVRPELFISVESEFWPNLLREAKRVGSRVALINGRMSQRSYLSYRKIRPLLTVLWENVDLYAVRQTEDAQRFSNLGVPECKIKLTGNLKYDFAFAQNGASNIQSNAYPTVVMGSTREGEEEQLLPMIEQVRAQIPNTQIIWAPRHIQRIPELENLLKTQGLEYRRISQLRLESPTAKAQVPHVLWDSMGDLLDAYREATVAVVGGSFVPNGGQNPIEPAALKLPVLFGPSMDNFQGVADHLVRSGGAKRVSLAELPGQLTILLQNSAECQAMGDRAQKAVFAEQGATQRTIDLLKDLLHA